MMGRIAKEFGVPVVVANDGDVTALAGAMSLNTHSILGVAMGSSEAAGYLTPQGRITGELHELAFAPVDFNPEAQGGTSGPATAGWARWTFRSRR